MCCLTVHRENALNCSTWLRERSRRWREGREEREGGRRDSRLEDSLHSLHEREEGGGRRQEGGGRRQEAGGRRQEAGGRRQEAGGRRNL